MKPMIPRRTSLQAVPLRRARPVALAAIVVLLAPSACQQAEGPDPGSQPEAAVELPRAEAGDTVQVIENRIAAERRPEFEEFIGEFWSLLQDVGKEDPETARAVERTRVLLPTEANEDGTWSYLFLMDPLIGDVNYEIANLLGRALPDEEAEEMLRRLGEAMDRPQNRWVTVQSEVGTTRAAAGDTVWIIRYPVSGEKREQFEGFAAEFWADGLSHTGAGPDFPEPFRKTRVLHPAHPDETGLWSYFIVMDPFIPDVDYSIGSLLARMHPEDEAERRLDRFQDAVAGSSQEWRLTQANMDRTVAQLRVYSFWEDGVEALRDRDLATSRERFLSASEVAREAGLDLEESFSHQYLAMAAGIVGDEALAEAQLERSLEAARGDAELEEFHEMTAAVAHAGLGNLDEARRALSRIDLDDPLTDRAAADVTRGVVAAALGDLEEARAIASGLEEVPAYRNAVRAFLVPVLAERGRTGEALELREEILAEEIPSFWDAVSRWKLEELTELPRAIPEPEAP